MTRYRLNLRERRDGWRLARSSWIEAGGDAKKAERIVRRKLEERYSNAMLILALLRLALAAFQLWIELNQSHPPIEDDEAMLSLQL